MAPTDPKGVEVQVGGWTVGAHNKNWAITAIISFLIALGAGGFGIYAAKRAEFYVLRGGTGGSFHAQATLHSAAKPGEKPSPVPPAPLGGSTGGKGGGQ